MEWLAISPAVMVAVMTIGLSPLHSDIKELRQDVQSLDRRVARIERALFREKADLL